MIATVAPRATSAHIPAPWFKSHRGAGMASHTQGDAPTDAVLLARIATGDERALAALYDRHAAMVYGLACAVVRDPADAEEVAADAFAQLWRTASDFDPARGSVVAWLCTITRSRALDRIRARQRRDRMMERAAVENADGFALPLAAVGPAPDGGAEQSELSRHVSRSVAALSHAQRQVVELAYFGGLSQSEIATHLAQPLGTVKTRMRSGMGKLRDALGPLFGEAS